MAFIWQSIEELEERGGALYFDGCSVVDLASEFGTPLYVYSETRLRKNYRRLRDAVRSHFDDYDIYYALKVNGNPSVVEVLSTEGAGADCASLQEVAIALEAGIPLDRTLFSGAFISRDELAAAVDLGVQINMARAAPSSIWRASARPRCCRSASTGRVPHDAGHRVQARRLRLQVRHHAGEGSSDYARAKELGVPGSASNAMAELQRATGVLRSAAAFTVRGRARLSARTGIEFQF